jgi:hypothetical protein
VDVAKWARLPARAPHVVVEHLPVDVVDVEVFLDAGGEADTVICPIGATRNPQAALK